MAMLCGLLGVWAGGACGKGLVPGSAHDQPMLPPFGGAIRPHGALAAAVNPIATVLWTDPLQRFPDVPMPAWAIHSTVTRSDDDAVDDSFSVEVYRPPPPDAVVEVPSGMDETALIAVGELVIVDDRDRDGTFRVTGPTAEIVAPDRFLGGSYQLLTYVERPFATPTTGTPTTFPGQVGYRLANCVCEGRNVVISPVPSQALQVIVQPSVSFPEVRNCGRSHSR